MRQAFRIVGLITILTVLGSYKAMTTVEAQSPSPFRELLDKSQKDNKGIMVYFRGQSIGGAVTKINADSVELRNQQYGRIIIKLDSIDAVAMN